MAKSNTIIILLISIYGIACTAPETYSCQPTFFQAQPAKILSDSSMSLIPAYWVRGKDTICGYDLKITNDCSFKLNPMEYPENLLEGFIFWEKDQIRYRPINTLTVDYPLFDFGVKVQSEYISNLVNHYIDTQKKLQYIDSVRCKIMLLQKIVDPAGYPQDTVYRFRLGPVSHPKLTEAEYAINWVVYVAQKRGIIGYYHTFGAESDEIEGIFCWKGNVYRHLMDSNKVKFLEHVLIE
jgi:hypothetical protein